MYWRALSRLKQKKLIDKNHEVERRLSARWTYATCSTKNPILQRLNGLHFYLLFSTPFWQELFYSHEYIWTDHCAKYKCDFISRTSFEFWTYELVCTEMLVWHDCCKEIFALKKWKKCKCIAKGILFESSCVVCENAFCFQYVLYRTCISILLQYVHPRVIELFIIAK